MNDCKYERTSAASGRGCNNGCSTCRGETTAAAAECVKCGTNFREAVCIHTDKIYDSCRELHCASYIFLQKIRQRTVGKGCSLPYSLLIFVHAACGNNVEDFYIIPLD